MILHENCEIRVEVDENDFVTITNKRQSGAAALITVGGNDLIVGRINGVLVAVIEGG